MNLAARILKLFHWKLNFTTPDFDKCIYCVAPHTSNWDFILGELAIHAVGRKAGFLMKSSWFVFPLGAIFRRMGGVPVYRNGRAGSLVEQLVRRFKSENKLRLAIAPEGTRKKVERWHTGFLRIAEEAGVPVVLGALDYPTRQIEISEVFYPTGDIEADLKSIQTYYSRFRGYK